MPANASSSSSVGIIAAYDGEAVRMIGVLSLFQFDSNLFLSVSNHDADRCAKCFGGWQRSDAAALLTCTSQI